jgi:hypothetical protein
MRMHSVISHGVIGCAGVQAMSSRPAISPPCHLSRKRPQSAKEVLNYSIASWRMFWAVD